MLVNKKSITYCSNIFHEKNINTLLFKLQDYIIFIKKSLKIDKLGLGLCLSNNILKKLLKKNKIDYINTWITSNNIYISSINGFVYQDFHKKKIKEHIYYPDWSTVKRLNYTKKIIDFVKINASNFNNISISTSPISFKKWVKQHNKKYLLFYSSLNFIKLLKIMIDTNKNINKYIHLDIEPEPSCTIESFDDFFYFYSEWLKKNTTYYLKQNYKNITYYLNKHINLCYDICHFSVNYEDQENIIKNIIKKKIKIGKVQISSAIEIFNNDDNLTSWQQNLAFLFKSNFLHQNTTIDQNHIIKKNIDINVINHTNVSKTRIHCHMPIYIKKYGDKIYTTKKETENTLINILKNLKVTHLELESYTYDMILQESKLESILKEYLLIIKLVKENA